MGDRKFFADRLFGMLEMRIKKILISVVFGLSLAVVGCGAKPVTEPGKPAAETVKEPTVEVAKQSEAKVSEADHVASGKETISRGDVVKEDMAPVYGNELKDGVYNIDVDSSSSMFKITACKLTVKDGVMSAVMTMGGTGYLKLYLGTGEEAVDASEADYIPYVETADGAHTYEVPVEALDKGIDCSAFSRKKEKWYERILVFRSDSLPADAFAEGKITTVESLKLEDGMYTVEVTLGGGSGRAFVESPAQVQVKDGIALATIIWSSSNYDYMKVDGEKYELISTEENSAFLIPVNGFDWKMPVAADTIAMSEPHEIDYTLIFDSATLKKAE